jgi:hypothetical protein
VFLFGPPGPSTVRTPLYAVDLSIDFLCHKSLNSTETHDCVPGAIPKVAVIFTQGPPVFIERVKLDKLVIIGNLETFLGLLITVLALVSFALSRQEKEKIRQSAYDEGHINRRK